MEYPPTSPTGITIIYPRMLEGKVHEPWEMMQYSRRGGHGAQGRASIPILVAFLGQLLCANVMESKSANILDQRSQI